MSQLLTPPNNRVLDAITSIMTAVSRVLPIPAKHRRDLPFAVRDLSRILTEERGSLSRSYWAAPRFLSAYAYYFLPWNLYRLAFLLPNLTLPLLPGSRVLDLGSGPLTLPLALWCSRPELRAVPLHFVCSDIAHKPMEVGLDVLKEADPDTLWTVSLERGPLEKSLGGKGESFHLIMGGNVLNELTPPKGMTLEERVGNIARALPGRLAANGMALLVEPGTRLGGKMISLARKGALECGFLPLAPCTHEHPCPAMEQAAFYTSSPPFNGWCHFLCDVENAPRPLQELTHKAGFKRQSLALSFLHLQARENREETGSSSFDLDELEALYAEAMGDDNDIDFPQEEIFSHGRRNDHSMNKSAPVDLPKPPIPARIISGDIRLAQTTARYACGAAGLSLVTGAHYASYGERVLITWKAPGERDAKTGALMVGRVREAHGNSGKKRQDPSEKSGTRSARSGARLASTARPDTNGRDADRQDTNRRDSAQQEKGRPEGRTGRAKPGEASDGKRGGSDRRGGADAGQRRKEKTPGNDLTSSPRPGTCRKGNVDTSAGEDQKRSSRKPRKQ